MGDRSAIEWTEATWNPATGCDRVSRGCDNCYRHSFAVRRASARWCSESEARDAERRGASPCGAGRCGRWNCRCGALLQVNALPGSSILFGF
ncbi:DUF5131 family protein, partial [Streptomyces sp. NPDC055134]